MRIATNDPVRAAVAGCSGYYDSRESAINSVREALGGCGYEIDGMQWNDTEDRYRYDLRAFCHDRGRMIDYDCWAVCSFYTMPSGKCELTAYIS